MSEETTDEEEEKIFYEARLTLARLASRKEVQQFLGACALNVISMERKGEIPEMTFKLCGREFKFLG